MKRSVVVSIFLLFAELQSVEADLATRWLHTSAEYQAIVRQTYTLATRLVREKIGGRDPGSWAVALDIDETLLSNSPYLWELQTQNLQSTSERWDAWVRRQQAPPLPGAVEFLQQVHEWGGRIVIVTNRHLAECPDTETNLEKHAIPYDIILCREDEREKEARWEAVQKGTASPDLPPLEILLWMGDYITDFPDLDQALRFKGSESFSLFGTRYLVIPNPVHGSWTKNTSATAH